MKVLMCNWCTRKIREDSIDIDLTGPNCCSKQCWKWLDEQLNWDIGGISGGNIYMGVNPRFKDE